ncbi:FAD-dependent oxidoreductase, partial [Acinetobacter higginsii]|uniref:FAD-dependent oxidoreductase n=1 Tax=Acinetobacter higginsii TaxID=70347 RepID=UPI003009A8DD
KLDSYDRRNHLVYLAILLTEDFTGLTNSNIVRKAIGSQGTVRSLDGELLFNTNNALFAQTSRLAKDYPTANWKRRRQIEKEIIEHYVNLCYFLATDTAVPAFIRTAMADFGHSPREWIDSPYGVGIQFKVYDRQTIRMVNDNVVSFYDFSQHFSTGHFNDPIGIFAYFFDGKKRLCFAAPATPDDKNWTLIEESRITVNEDSPLYAIPMRMLLPRKTECSNLVVAWCSAQTELAFHSCRMEATGGIQGEAAAAVCVAKIKNKLGAVQDVAYT